MNEWIEGLISDVELKKMRLVILRGEVYTESTMIGDIYVPMKITLEFAVLPAEIPDFMPEAAKLALRLLKVIKE